MKMKSLLFLAVVTIDWCLGFAPLPLTFQTTKTATTTTSLSASSVVLPVDPDSGKPSIVGITGGGYLATLLAKTAAIAGYDTWMLCREPEVESKIKPLLSSPSNDNEMPSNLEIITSPDKMGERLPQTNAIMIAVDAFATIPITGLDYIFEAAGVDNEGDSSCLKRIVAMTRNLNGSGMGFVPSTSRKVANPEVWDNSEKAMYQEFERALVDACQKRQIDYTLVRAGTLKGGGCGAGAGEEKDESYYSQYLPPIFYQMTKRDLVAWQLLFDANVRGVKLTKGDVLPGPGFQAVITATGTEVHDGDSSRCAVADAMVQSLRFPAAANADFGIATAKSRTPPTNKEWDELFSVL